jgi:hypothetical protein
MAISLQHVGFYGALWSYPTVLLFTFALSRRMANVGQRPAAAAHQHARVSPHRHGVHHSIFRDPDAHHHPGQHHPEQRA